MKEVIFFWIAWGIISFWAFKTFYYSFSKEKIKRLRKAALGINLSVLILLFLPWFPIELGGKTGFRLAVEGNIPAVLFLFLLFLSIMSFLNKEPKILKLGAIISVLNIFILFILMYQLRPETFVLTLYDIAPIIAALLLLVNGVAVLLLWQQLQLKPRK